jgi:hypothetical protein
VLLIAEVSFGLGVGLALGFAVRYVLLFDVWMVAFSFGLGVGVALGFTVRKLLLFELLTAFSALLGVGVGVAFGSFALLLGTAKKSRLHSNGTIKRIPGMFIQPA